MTQQTIEADGQSPTAGNATTGSNVTPIGAKAPKALADMKADLFSQVKTELVERCRADAFDDAADEMFPARTPEEESDGRELTDEEERAVTVRVKEKIEAFKARLDEAIRATPLEETFFIDAAGREWEDDAPTPINDKLCVFAKFDDGDTVVVFCYPVAPGAAWQRIILSRHAPSGSAIRLTYAAWKHLVVKEYVAAYLDFYGEALHVSPENEEKLP